MARKDPPFRNTFTTGAKSQKELRETLNAELQQRLAAKTILNPDEVAGEYDFSRLLFTTLGGQARPLTVEDLHSFRASAKALGNKYKGGIRPKQVIDASLKADRDRAHREIKQAIPVTYRGGRIQFQTNSGPNSDTTRHQLVVELLNYDAAVASPKPASKIVKEMLAGPVKLECKLYYAISPNAKHLGINIELKAKLGPINWQFAPSTRYEHDDVEAFLELLPPEFNGSPLRHAMEVRHDSFVTPAFVDLARAHNAAVVYAHSKDYPAIADPTSDFVYARLQQSRETEKTGYSSSELKAWEERIALWETGGTPKDLALLSKAPAKKPGRSTTGSAMP